MDLQSNATASGETDTFAPAAPPVPAGGEPMNAREAARALARHRRRRADSVEPSSADTDGQAAVPDAAPAPAQELAVEADAAPDQDQPSGETQATEPEGNLPPIEPPRSWTTEEKERFKSLPRELQAYLSERE
jgi:hypothetical protein